MGIVTYDFSARDSRFALLPGTLSRRGRTDNVDTFADDGKDKKEKQRASKDVTVYSEVHIVICV